jgi:hypothetical protein
MVNHCFSGVEEKPELSLLKPAMVYAVLDAIFEDFKENK